MKKIDFHIHTVPTVWDAAFTFDFDILKRYVSEAGLDAIAITNHNLFDRDQFEEIAGGLDIPVFPGVEVSLDCGHILIIAEVVNLDAFQEQAREVRDRITQPTDRMSIDDLTAVFTTLSAHLVIPHYGKKPAISATELKRLSGFVWCGEVDSAKKFIRAIKDGAALTPVLFSDARICCDLEPLPTRQTFVDCGELNLTALRICLRDKNKVALSERDGNRLFRVFENGQMLSTGLNILLGERSSGKTFILDGINDSNENVKYIQQFSLVQQDDGEYEREFNKELQNDKSLFAQKYLADFKVALDDVMGVDLRADDLTVDAYVNSLIESAEAADRKDAFSKTALFGTSEFALSDDKVLSALIDSVIQLIENIVYRDIIGKHVDIGSLRRLAIELIELFRDKNLTSKKKRLVNDLLKKIKPVLRRHTSAVAVEDVDLYQVSLNKKKVSRFSEIVKRLQAEATIWEESIQGFRVVATKGPFAGAGEIKDVSRVMTAFKDAYEEYDEPYTYLRELLKIDALPRSELYRLFVKISYQIINKDGFEVSGGERSEFRLLQKLKDAHNYDVLLVDEPESSFDNIFLHSDVNEIIRELSKTMPVVVVTHNSTVGASIGADYLLYAQKTTKGRKVIYRLYSGYPTDQTLRCVDGTAISSHEIMLNSLEAGPKAYEQRRGGYEALKDR